jgi:hypothetical protein
MPFCLKKWIFAKNYIYSILKFMKKVFSIILLSITMIACQTQKTEQPVVSSVLPSDQASEILKTISGQGFIRDFSLGDSASKVISTEKLDKIVEEEDANSLGYTHDTEAFETIDIFYQKDASSTLIKSINVDIYPNSEADTKKYLAEIVAFYDTKFGKNTDKTWKLADDKSLVLRNATKGKMQLLNIEVK